MNLLVELESFHDGIACIHHPATMSLADSPRGSLAQCWSWQLSDRTCQSGISHICLCEWRLMFLLSCTIYIPATTGALWLDIDRNSWVSELLKLLEQGTTALELLKLPLMSKYMWYKSFHIMCSSELNLPSRYFFRNLNYICQGHSVNISSKSNCLSQLIYQCLSPNLITASSTQVKTQY